jgi:hypothetical protein
MKLTPTLTLPSEIFKFHWAALGITGSGKSYTIKWFVEQLLEAQQRVCIVDPKGDWWGLKSSADGKSAGYPLVIFGGEHADVPIDQTSGAVVGELVATGNRPCIIDLKHFSEAAKCTFMIGFLGEIFRRNKARLMLVLDEAHEFAPQNPMREEIMLLHWTNKLLSQGRSLGVQVVLSSQRPAKVHKDSLTQTQVLFALRVISVQDRKAVEGWVAGVGDTKQAKSVTDSLARLPVGEGWLYAPGSEILERVKFPRIKTYDSSATPEHAEFKMPKGWASVNLDELSAKMVQVKTEVDANDPAKLKTQIAELKRQLRDQQATPVRIDAGELGKAQEDIATLRGLLETESLSVNSLASRASGIASRLDELVKELFEVAHEHSQKNFERASKPWPGSSQTKPDTHVKAPRDVQENAARHAPTASGATGGGGNRASADGLTGPETAILNALAFWSKCGEENPTRPAVAVVANYSASSSSFVKAAGSLRVKGLISYPTADTFALTRAGEAATPRSDVRLTLADFQSKLLGLLPGPEAAVLRVAMNVYPARISREACAKGAGYSANSSSFVKAAGSLRSRGFLDYPDAQSFVALDVVFPKQLR